MRRLLTAALCWAAIASAAPAGAQDKEDVVAGPGRFCGHFFALDLAADEKASRSYPADFSLYSLQSPRGSFGIYEGFAPQMFENEHVPVSVAGFDKVERLRDSEGSYSYLVSLPHSAGPQFYLHLYGAGWKGDDSDLALVARVKLGDPEAMHCPEAR
jgi:hypothetical protein